MIQLKNVSLTFNPNTVNQKKAIDHLSLTLEKGDFVTVIGSNGAGKSTLMNLIAGSYESDEGSILLDGQDITYYPEFKRANLIGRIFQDPMLGTAPHLSVLENLALAYGRGQKRNPLASFHKREDKNKFIEILSPLNLGLEERLDSEVGLLSGGQRQALSLCMTTINTPKLLLLDEHTAALDPKTSEQVMNITQQIITDNQITTLMITHNIEHALKYGNKTIVMNEGKIAFMLEGEERKKMSVEKLIELYSSQTKHAFSDSMIL